MFEGRTDEEIRASVFLVSPATIKTIEKLQYYERSADRGILEAEAIVKKMKEYKMMLYQRAQVLTTAGYHYKLKLERCINYSNNRKNYTVTIYKIFESVGEIVELQEKYTGVERNKAIARFNQLKKERPNIEAETDIQKRKWER